jgi:uncharacterized membrane protein
MMLLDGLRMALAVFVIGAGVMHFVSPRGFERIVPSYLPAPRALVLVSGACEIALGVLLLVPSTRLVAALGLMALFVAVFPANVHMAQHKVSLGNRSLPTWLLWARLPFQLVFIAWAWLVR